MKSFVSILTLLSLIIAGGSCKHEIPGGAGGGGNNNPPTGGGQPCSADTAYFVNDILPLIVQSCAKSGCHDQNTASDGVILTNYQNIMTTGGVVPGRPDNSELYDVITETDPDKVMPKPPASPLTAAQIALIYKWIAQGALNNSCLKSCDSTQFTYSGAISGIIQSNCINCHSGATPQGGILLVTYDQVKAQCVNGKLMPAVTKTGPRPMPPSPSLKLSNCNISQINNWIINNYPQ